MNDKFILDACCGNRMMWFDKNNKNTLYMDIREEVKPDLVGDYTDLSKLGKFKLIVFDPQFRTEKDGCPAGFVKSYGALLKPDWRISFNRAIKQMWEHLEDYGILIFKWNDAKIKKEFALNSFLPLKPLFGQTTTGEKGKKDKKTYWFCFMKIPEQLQKEIGEEKGK